MRHGQHIRCQGVACIAFAAPRKRTVQKRTQGFAAPRKGTGFAAYQQRRLLRGFDIGSDQQAPPAGIHAQHTGNGIGLLRLQAGRRMQHRETHAIPIPGIARAARGLRYRHCPQRMIRRQRRAQQTHPQAGQHRCRAARMVVVGVADNHFIEPPHTHRPQVGRDDAVAAVRLGGISRTGIKQQIMRRGLYMNRQSLSDIQHDDFGFSNRWTWRGDGQQR